MSTRRALHRKESSHPTHILDPPAIGTVMSFYGVLSGVLTVFFFSRMADRFGVKRVYLMGIAAAVPSFSLFPVISYLARSSIGRSSESGTDVWVMVGLQVSASGWFLYATVRPSQRSRAIYMSFSRFRRGVHLHRRSHTE